MHKMFMIAALIFVSGCAVHPKTCSKKAQMLRVHQEQIAQSYIKQYCDTPRIKDKGIVINYDYNESGECVAHVEVVK